MAGKSNVSLQEVWARHNEEWRDCRQVTTHSREAAQTDRSLLEFRVRGNWWETLHDLGITLLVTREYEHLVLAVSCTSAGPNITFYPLPHPSGLVVNRKSSTVFVASTRNPNQVYEMKPATGTLERLDRPVEPIPGQPLVPTRTWFLPGCLYIHDLAIIGGRLHANAVGQNAIVELGTDSSFAQVWWPLCAETNGKPVFTRNHLQVNSIAAGKNIRSSFFSASSTHMGRRRPGHRNFPVDGRGVIFSGATREPIVSGLTRPHSARLLGETVWVDNSGYGQLGRVADGRFVAVTKLDGWTRGLCFNGSTAFVGTSRVIPRFKQYAPGLDVDRSICGVHAIDTKTGKTLGSLIWPRGNQIFAIDWISSKATLGFPFQARGKRRMNAEIGLFYAFQTNR